MPVIKINGADIYYEIHGEGKETILLSHGLLWSGRMFEPQVAHFKSRYSVITYDHRGQGRSQVTESGYDMDSLYEDAVALIEQLDIKGCHMGGLSMGGFVAMRVAARRPDLIRSLILMETSADTEPNKFKYSLLNNTVKLLGVKAVSAKVMPIMFGQTFLKDPNRKTERTFWKQQLESNPKTIVRSVNGVVNRLGIYDEIAGIQLPTLILVGEEDVATVPEKAQRIHTQIKNAQLVILKNAGHSSTVEEPEQVNEAIEQFLKNLKN